MRNKDATRGILCSRAAGLHAGVSGHRYMSPRGASSTTESRIRVSQSGQFRRGPPALTEGLGAADPPLCGETQWPSKNPESLREGAFNSSMLNAHKIPLVSSCQLHVVSFKRGHIAHSHEGRLHTQRSTNSRTARAPKATVTIQLKPGWRGQPAGIQSFDCERRA